MRALFLLLALSVAFTSCDLFSGTPAGCTDPFALNHDASAEEDDGSCRFSEVIFYKVPDGPPVEVSVDGQPVGTITAFYPDGPEACSAPGTPSYQLQDGLRHAWEGASGPFRSTGTVQANPSAACIQVRVF